MKAAPGYVCDGTEAVTAILLEDKTNSTGWVHFDGFWGNYYKVTVSYANRTYDFTAPIGNNSTTFVTIHLPSGSLQISYG